MEEKTQSNPGVQPSVVKTEKDLIDELASTEFWLKEAKDNFIAAKKALTHAETAVVNARVSRDRAKEALRVHRATTVRHDPSKRDQEIEQFRQDNPETMEFIKQRDGIKEENDQE